MPYVLVVEDDEFLRDAVVEAIEMAGYDVEQAENGRIALDKMRATSPCIVLLDLMMPVMDGWEVVSEMTKDPKLASVPVCIVSAQNQLTPPKHVRLLRKPVTVASLLQTVEDYCGSRG
jgi:CheY-like chemotaxis protein